MEKLALKKTYDALNFYGAVSTPYIVRNFSVTFEEARKILKQLTELNDHIIARNQDQIYVQGRIPAMWKPKPKKPRTSKIPKRRIWKDVTRP